jgi:hypothetical protein
MYIDINTLFTFEGSKSDDQSILAAIVLNYITFLIYNANIFDLLLYLLIFYYTCTTI